MTPHNLASLGEIAKVVLAPGDPERCTYIANKFLDNARLVSQKRGNVVYTGSYDGVEVSLASTGMGAASAGIYTYELYRFFGVEAIIRIGTSGGLIKEIDPGDLVIAMSASTDGAYAHQYGLKGTYSPCPDFVLFQKAISVVEREKFPFFAGQVFSSEYFSEYNALGPQNVTLWARMGAIAQDMETYSLFCNASYLHKKALSILTMTDNCITGRSVKDEERMSCLDNMIKTALITAKECYDEL